MAHDSVFAPSYTASWAITIGIDRYKVGTPLGYACNDARAIASHLIEKLKFPSENVRVLCDADATRSAIMSAFLNMEKCTAANDRLIVFFAGHGFTRSSRRGEVGYLVPHDGDPSDLSTMVRWDELTRNAELIPAKHVLFVMDACYGGLALTRAVPQGSQRFLKDMLARYARQVLSAGKADETVADSGGPRAGHSVFTGHLLDALEGGARASDGIITATGVMNYVYDKVGKDQFSRQTPSFGLLDGDGDLVIEAPRLEMLLEDRYRDTDVLVEPMAAPISVPSAENRQQLADLVKEYLSEPKYRIKLEDLWNSEIRRFDALVAQENFPLHTTTHTGEDIAERLRRYERAVDRLACIGTLVSRWGGPEHRTALASASGRLAEPNEQMDGQSVWLGLRWHSADVYLAAAGVAALSAGSYENLAAVLTSRVRPSKSAQGETILLASTIDGVWNAMRLDAYKLLPGHERNYTPRSEYLFKVVQPLVEDLLYLGRKYESLFDRYEVMAALIYADQDLQARSNSQRVWGPPGRFAWKDRGGGSLGPIHEVLSEAATEGKDWPALRAGLFGGDYERFVAVASSFRSFVAQLPFH